MNRYVAKQRTDDKRWDYTCTNDKRTWPVGYCAAWRAWPDDLPSNPEQRRQHDQNKDKHHDSGHTTAEEAAACYASYLLDTSLRLRDGLEGDPSTMSRCRVKGCNQFTFGYATVAAYHLWPLCDLHRTREIVAGLFDVSESWES